MKETKEEFIKRMLDEKADKNNIIDLNAYGIGLEEMYEALNLHFVSQQRELLKNFLDWGDGKWFTGTPRNEDYEKILDEFFNCG